MDFLYRGLKIGVSAFRQDQPVQGHYGKGVYFAPSPGPAAQWVGSHGVVVKYKILKPLTLKYYHEEVDHGVDVMKRLDSMYDGVQLSHKNQEAGRQIILRNATKLVKPVGYWKIEGPVYSGSLSDKSMAPLPLRATAAAVWTTTQDVSDQLGLILQLQGLGIKSVSDVKMLPISKITVPKPEKQNAFKVVNIKNAILNTPNQVPPIAVDQQYQLLDGHHRLEAAKLLGLDKVPVKIVTTIKLSDVQLNVDKDFVLRLEHSGSSSDSWSLFKKLDFSDSKVGFVTIYYYEGTGPALGQIDVRTSSGQRGLGKKIIPMLVEYYGSLTSDPQGNTNSFAVKMWESLKAKKIPTDKNTKGYMYKLP